MTDLRAQIEWVKKFIEYARYELQPGEAKIGSQFPHQADADKAIGILDKLLADHAAPAVAPSVDRAIEELVTLWWKAAGFPSTNLVKLEREIKAILAAPVVGETPRWPRWPRGPKCGAATEPPCGYCGLDPDPRVGETPREPPSE
jgi:hypothetical protein